MLRKLILPLSIGAIAALAVNREKKFPLIGDYAPEFRAKSTFGEINFPSDYSGSWVIFFSHPGDFTPVCTTEFIEFQKLKDEFESLNTKLLGLSVENVSSHLRWIESINHMNYQGNENVKITFPIIDDKHLSVAKLYGMIHKNVSNRETVRSVFIIDPIGKIRAILYYPMSNGRNIYEIKRLLMALQTTDEFNVATPANWQVGEDIIVPLNEGKTPEEKSPKCSKGTKYSWYLCMKNISKDDVLNKIQK